MKLIQSFVTTLFAALAFAVDYRLESNVVPDSYNITIQPYIRSDDGERQFTFNGSIEINIHAVATDAKEITVHTKNLEIFKAEVCFNELVLVTEKHHTYDDVTNKFTIHLKDALTVGYSYKIGMSYKGQIDDDLRLGFTRVLTSNLMGKSGTIRSYSSESVHVRWSVKSPPVPRTIDNYHCNVCKKCTFTNQ